MKEFLALITKTPEGFDGLIPELTVLAVDDTIDQVKARLSEGLALYLADQETASTQPGARTFSDLPAEVQDDYTGLEPVEVLISPAEINPISKNVERAIRQSGLSEREIARQMGTGHAAIHRMTDPFYWGQTAGSLRKLAAVLNLGLDVELAEPILLPSGAIISHHWGGEVPPQVRLAKIPETEHLELPTMVQSPEMGIVRLHSISEDLWQNDANSVVYYGYPLR